ncbi:hypothetical protein OG520_22110 [Streptomyces sp. NBC_00984]|uniref:hypothetical protein n=1 Tax=Streptomyces sp. NBC_00984 TaxID=2903700 RepID=UPI003866FB91|nr:hypothetical protein OG520_22110 [Streptomyces sp. NBC_00984]
MTLWQPGMRITAARLNDFTPVPLASTATPAAAFTLTSFTARKTGGVVEWSIILVRNGGAITADAKGNIGDTDCATLPSDCRPGAIYFAPFDTAGIASGAVRVATNGLCTLTSLDPTASIASGATVNFSGAFAAG